MGDERRTTHTPGHPWMIGAPVEAPVAAGLRPAVGDRNIPAARVDEPGLASRLVSQSYSTTVNVASRASFCAPWEIVVRSTY
jgi:hypothetical protein